MEYRVLNEQDVQEILGLGWKQTAALMRAEGFPAVRIGRNFRVLEDKLYEWLSTSKRVKLDYHAL